MRRADCKLLLPVVCGWKERQVLARELKAIYRAKTAEVALKRLSQSSKRALGAKSIR